MGRQGTGLVEGLPRFSPPGRLLIGEDEVEAGVEPPLWRSTGRVLLVNGLSFLQHGHRVPGTLPRFPRKQPGPGPIGEEIPLVASGFGVFGVEAQVGMEALEQRRGLLRAAEILQQAGQGKLGLPARPVHRNFFRQAGVDPKLLQSRAVVADPTGENTFLKGDQGLRIRLSPAREAQARQELARFAETSLVRIKTCQQSGFLELTAQTVFSVVCRNPLLEEELLLLVFALQAGQRSKGSQEDPSFLPGRHSPALFQETPCFPVLAAASELAKLAQPGRPLSPGEQQRPGWAVGAVRLPQPHREPGVLWR
jgi:hypothetical protein